ncbi:MAG: lamin tail domain-containing protein [Bacteroidota bacterium]|nr:lamin tail domain-containing protein [Bacteroidota bacterium]
MKNLSLFFVFFVPVLCFGQVNENFSDGNFTDYPVWTGTTSNFFVNGAFQLQSQAKTTSTSFLFTPSEAFDNATWECSVKITYNPSAYNFAAVYIASDRNDITSGCNGYYVQLGGTNDEVSLYLQEGTKKTKIIDGTDKRTDRNPVDLKIKVTRDSQGNFTLYSKLATETDFVQEGTTKNNAVKSSAYFGLLFTNTTQTGSDYYFDDIVVTGDKALDEESPEWTSFSLEQPNRLKLGFSEAMNFTQAAYNVDQDIGSPASQAVATDNKSVILSFGTDFEHGKIYTLQTSGLTDLAGNQLIINARSIGIAEPIGIGDLVINEVMFDSPDSCAEYLEIYNKSDKLLDVSGLVFAIRKADGTLNAGNSIPNETNMLPYAYLALTSDADKVRKYYAAPDGSAILTTGWSPLNNESSTLVLTNNAKDTVYDELTYNVKWHHSLVKNPQGVALERINPELPTQNPDSWHSAASEVNYGTPGYKNSQYRDLDSKEKDEKFVWTEPESFSPDNDGVDDVCFIHYKTDANGYVANATILNAVGVKVFQLATNILLPTEGFLTWDGRTDKGKNANVGIYVLYFEMFNPNTGKRKQQKLPIVVSSR